MTSASSSRGAEERPRARAVEVHDLDDGCALLDIETEAVHILNAAAAFILSLCDGSHTPSQLADELCRAVPSLEAAQAASDVEAALHDLRGKGLLE